MIFNTRPAKPKDFPAIASLLNAAYALVGVDLKETPEDVLKRAMASLVIVTEMGGVVAATITVASAGTKYGTLATKGQMEASRLAVDPMFQGRGVGRAMLKAVTESCRNQGVQALVGVTLDSMTTAHHLYESKGATAARVPGLKARGYTLDLTDNHNEKDTK